EAADLELHEFTRRLIALRREHPVFRRRRWFQGRAIHGVDDLAWFKPDGEQMSDDDWSNGFAKSLAVYLNGRAIASPGPRGERIADDSFYLAVNAHHEPLEFRLPGVPFAERWQAVLETDRPLPEAGGVSAGGATLILESRSLTLLR